jgi:hypothetical protein
VQDGYTVVPDTYIEGVWTHVQDPFVTAKHWCDHYAACRGFSQKDGDDQYWWLGTGDYTTGKSTRPAPGYTTYLKAASGGASGTSNTSAGHLQVANPSSVDVLPSACDEFSTPSKCPITFCKLTDNGCRAKSACDEFSAQVCPSYCKVENGACTDKSSSVDVDALGRLGSGGYEAWCEEQTTLSACPGAACKWNFEDSVCTEKSCDEIYHFSYCEMKSDCKWEDDACKVK